MVMFFEMVLWWYGKGWRSAFKLAIDWPKAAAKAFSIKILITTLFAPWRRIVSVPGRSIDEKMRAAVDNLTSRFVGFFVRLGALAAAAVISLLSLLAGVVLALSWPLIPLLFIYLVYRSIAG